jgi:hypothetical protein
VVKRPERCIQPRRNQSLACQANALGVSLTDQGAYSFHTALAIEFKNRGSACTITGYPGVDALSATGRRILSPERTKSG